MVPVEGLFPWRGFVAEHLSSGVARHHECVVWIPPNIAGVGQQLGASGMLVRGRSTSANRGSLTSPQHS